MVMGIMLDLTCLSSFDRRTSKDLGQTYSPGNGPAENNLTETVQCSNCLPLRAYPVTYEPHFMCKLSVYHVLFPTKSEYLLFRN
jgi:hypothetical protein